MSLWGKAQQLPPEALQKVRSVYGEHFPIEVRHFLSNWIEEKIWYVKYYHTIECANELLKPNYPVAGRI